jgi:hypothetical protein
MGLGGVVAVMVQIELNLQLWSKLAGVVTVRFTWLHRQHYLLGFWTEVLHSHALAFSFLVFCFTRFSPCSKLLMCVYPAMKRLLHFVIFSPSWVGVSSDMIQSCWLSSILFFYRYLHLGSPWLVKIWWTDHLSVSMYEQYSIASTSLSCTTNYCHGSFPNQISCCVLFYLVSENFFFVQVCHGLQLRWVIRAKWYRYWWLSRILIYQVVASLFLFEKIALQWVHVKLCLCNVV